MGGIAKNEHPLTGEVGGIHRARIPRQPRAPFSGAGAIGCGFKLSGQLQTQHPVQLPQKGGRSADTDRHCLHRLHAEAALQPAAYRARQLGIKAHIGVSRGDPHEVGRTGPQGRHHRHINAIASQQLADLAHIVAAAETQQAWSQQIHPGPPALGTPASRVGLGLAGRWHLGLEQSSHQLIESFSATPVLLLGVGRQFQAHHRDAAQVHGRRQGARLVLDKFGRAALAHQQRLGLEALHGCSDRTLHKLGGVATQVAGLEGGVGNGRAPVPPFNHREQQIGIGVALGGVQHVVHTLHRGGYAHGTHVRGAFVGPEGEFHD